MFGHPHSQLVRVANPTFRLFDSGFTSGLHLLNPFLGINGVTVTPDFLYKGQDATVSQWDQSGYGQLLLNSAIGTDPTVGEDTPLLSTVDKSVLFNTGDTYDATNTTFGEIGTRDFVIECVFQGAGSGANASHCSKRSGNVDGWNLFDSSGTFQCSIRRNSTAATIQSAASALVTDCWYHVMVFGDRSGSGQIYINGASSGSAVSLTGVPDCTAGVAFNIGSFNSAHLFPYTKRIAYLALWTRESWLDTHLQAAVAKERFSRLTGFYPTCHKGTAVPVQISRLTTAHIRKHNLSSGVSNIFQVGNSWPRVSEAPWGIGNKVAGLLSETTQTNLCLQSEALGTTWAVVDAGDTISSNAIVAPNLNLAADGIIGDSTDGQHGVTQAATLTAVSYVFSVFLKAGDKTWGYISNNTVTNAFAYFNLSTGVIGTKGAGASQAHIENWGNGWYRCAIAYTGTVASHTHQISPADADTDNSVVGDGATVNIYAWGAQIETGTYPTSYIPTTTATATRNGDSIYYKGDDGNLGGVGSNKANKISLNYLIVDHDLTLSITTWSLNDGGVATERIINTFESTSDRSGLFATAGGSLTINGNGTRDSANGVPHNITSAFRIGRASLMVDGTLEFAIQTPADLPDDLDRITMGVSSNDLNQFNGLIYNFKITPR